MKILITGAEVTKQGEMYSVVFENRQLMLTPNKDTALLFAMDREKLYNETELITSNVYHLMARSG
jgi:hypothetical protein